MVVGAAAYVASVRGIKKHARHDPRDTTWIEWVTTGRLELVFNTQILGYWKQNKKRKRHSPKRFMNEQSPDGK